MLPLETGSPNGSVTGCTLGDLVTLELSVWDNLGYQHGKLDPNLPIKVMNSLESSLIR